MNRERERERETDRHRDRHRETDRDRDGQTERQAGRQTDRQREPMAPKINEQSDKYTTRKHNNQNLPNTRDTRLNPILASSVTT